MKKDDNPLLKYYFQLKVVNQEENISKNIPAFSTEIIRSYSLEGVTSLFNLVKTNLNENNDLQNNIFPMKTDYLDYVTSKDYDEEKMRDIKADLSDYLVKAKKDSLLEPFYHCFQYELEVNTGQDIVLNFGVFNYYEQDLLLELQLEGGKKKKKKDKKTYVGKALILVSDKPIFSLMKKILDKIYIDFLSESKICSNIENFIIEIFKSLKNNVQKINISNGEEKIIYNPLKDSILPFCDLNIGYFLEIFDINDIFVIAEYYFLTKSIIIISPNCELLYPIYHILMTLFFPLNFHHKDYFFKLLNPYIVAAGLCSPLPCFYFMYTDKNKNNGFISNDIIEKFAQNKSEVLIYQIRAYGDKKNKIEVKKNIYLYEKNLKKVSIDKMKNKTFLENTMKTNANFLIYFSIIEDQVNEIKKKMKNKKTDICDIPLNLETYDILKKNFFGLIIKFLVIKIQPVAFRFNDDNKMEICPLSVMVSQKKKLTKSFFRKIINVEKKEEKNKENQEKKLKDFYEDSPQTEIIYKDEIIKQNHFDFDYLKTQIFIDYFIKISQRDPNRLYFDDDYTSIKTDKINEINFNDLFNYFSKDYDLNDKVKFIYNIIGNKNTGNKLKGKLGLFKKYITFFINNKDPIILSNPDIYKYYSLILYEAKIFKKIFYAINNKTKTLEIVACAVGLFISLYILNLFFKISNNEENDKLLLETIEELYDNLFDLFIQTKCFYGKYNFIITLMFLILTIHKPLKEDYLLKFMLELQALKNVPSIIIFLLYNNNIEFKLSVNKEIKDPYKEIKIKSIEEIAHEHKFVVDTLSDGFVCNKYPFCEEYMSFNITNTVHSEPFKEMLINPVHFINRILKKIEKNNSLIIPEIDNIDDIDQIAIWDYIYFNLGLFRDKSPIANNSKCKEILDEIEY